MSFNLFFLILMNSADSIAKNETVKTDFSHIPRVAKKSGDLKILIVEDDDINMLLINIILNKQKIKSIKAYNGQEAVNLCKKENFDFVLMDIGLPVMDGISAARKIRKNEKETGFRTSIIALTAHVDEETVRKCIDSGIDFHLSKPIDENLLFEILLK